MRVPPAKTVLILAIATALSGACTGRSRAPKTAAPGSSATSGDSHASPEAQPGEPGVTQQSPDGEAPGTHQEEAPSETVPAPQGPKARFPNSVFPPANVKPPFERSAQPGDGEWAAFTSEGSGSDASADPPLMVTTKIHPHKRSRFIQLTVIALDLERLNVHFNLGLDDHGVERVSDPGLVRASHRPSLLAVFNGGFQARHGYWGVMLDDHVLLKPKDIGCTIALDAEGRATLGSWSALTNRQQQFKAYRQTPPCLVEDGQINARLESGNDRMWGGKNPDRITRRRSAVGIDATGRTLYYALGMETDALMLARGMQNIGAHCAAQLDINWNWTRFLVFGEKDGKKQVVRTLTEHMAHGKTEYVARPTRRDFFYVSLRE